MPRFMTFEGSDGRPVRADLHVATGDAPTVVLCHGFKGFRGWGFMPWLAERLHAAGLNALRIDFSHNGVEESDFDRLDLFLLDTWTRHQEDLRAVVDGLGDGPLHLLGHSRGGADAILFAATDPRIRSVIGLAAVADTTRTFPDVEERLRTLGYYPVPNTRTGQTMPIARTALDDGSRHDVLAAARSLSGRPLLLIHGDEDESVPLADLRAIAAAHGNPRILEVERAGHTFGARHPFAGPTPALEEAAEAVVAFIAADSR